jgi:hypothetical protein
MRRLLPLILLASCATGPGTAPAPEIRIVHECTWVTTLKHTFAAGDTPETKREMIAITDAIAKNCPGKGS